jgi:lysophospholipase L1-like esterase
MRHRLGKGFAIRSGNGLLSLIVVGLMAPLSGCAVKVTPMSLAMTATSPNTPTTSGSSSTSETTATAGPATPATPAAPAAPAVPAATGFASVTNFGDSITCGYYALPNDGAGYMYSNEGYATLLNAKVGGVAKNLCRGGDMAADMARLWVPNAEPGLAESQLYTVLIGTNDAHFCGGAAGCLANWGASLAASLAWLALPAADKVMGSAMTASQGIWSADLETGRATTHNGATLDFAVNQAVAGRELHVAYRVFDATAAHGGTATVSVDGIAVATLNATVGTGHPIATQNGGTDTVFLANVPLGAAGQHKVTIATTSAEGGFFSVLWAGVSTGNYTRVSGAPTVLIGQVTPTGNDDLNGVVAQYNAALAPLVAKLVAEGMNIVVAQTAKAFDPATEMSDMLHPNNAGHAKLAAAFVQALPVVD